jgi:aspartate-semialdehyde dehydrogenase
MTPSGPSSEASSKPSPGNSLRIVIVGATSLRGKEVVEVIKERIPSAELKLLDEEIAAGVLIDAAGEPAIIQSVDEESFEGASIVVFAGNEAFSAKHAEAALRGTATVIDMTGGLRSRQEVRPWIPTLDTIFPINSFTSSQAPNAYLSPSAPVIIASALGAVLKQWTPTVCNIVFLQPVSDRGIEGIEELERQTVSLLSFQPIAQPVFDAQVAFNVLDRYGEKNNQSLAATRSAISRDVAAYLDGRASVPAVQLLQVPVFHSHAFTAFAELTGAPEPAEVEAQLAASGFQFAEAGEPAPSAISAAGAAQPLMGHVERDPNHWKGYWFWGVSDNLRLSAENVVAIVERVLDAKDD